MTIMYILQSLQKSVLAPMEGKKRALDDNISYVEHAA